MVKIIRVSLLAMGLLGLTLSSPAQEAKYYHKLADQSVQCQLCPRECIIAPGQTGYCQVRKNVKGRLTALTYAQVCSLSVDPIEKKPLFHFLPTTPTLSLATAGCNLRCVFCQNWSISQANPKDVQATTLQPQDVVKAAQAKQCPSISYTYSEPTVFYEYMYDTAWLAHQHGLRNTVITCGYINPFPLKKLCTVIDATHVDLKGFTDKTYRLMAAAKLSPLLAALKIYKANGVWVEVGYLVIPSVNDNPSEIRAMTDWVVKNLGPDVPVHFLRFFPNHKLRQLPPTPVQTLEMAADLAQASGVRYVYLGNVPGHAREQTYCPQCKKIVIKRKGYFIEELNIKQGQCAFCGNPIPGVWQ